MGASIKSNTVDSTKKESKNAYIKRRTLELYDQLSQDKEIRKSQTDIRDKIIELNYTFFGYVASHTFVNNTYISYEDKLQSALSHFCECWWWYKWNGDETHGPYRSDLSFSVFYKPRISEMITRELNEVKYSVERSLRMEAGKQLGKHWAQVRYEDLKDVDLPVEKMNSLKAIFGSLYVADIADHEIYLKGDVEREDILDTLPEDYDTIEELLLEEMVINENKLTEKDLKKIAKIHQLDIDELKEKLPIAENMLYQRIQQNMDLIDIWNE